MDRRASRRRHRSLTRINLSSLEHRGFLWPMFALGVGFCGSQQRLLGCWGVTISSHSPKSALLAAEELQASVLESSHEGMRHGAAQGHGAGPWTLTTVEQIKRWPRVESSTSRTIANRVVAYRGTLSIDPRNLLCMSTPLDSTNHGSIFEMQVGP